MFKNIIKYTVIISLYKNIERSHEHALLESRERSAPVSRRRCI